MTEIIDSHAHLTWESFENDQTEVIARAFASNVVQIVQAGVDLNSIPEMVKLAEQHPQIFLGVGLHPHEAKDFSEQSETILRSAAVHPKTVAIGECGLDYHYDHSDHASQIYAFTRQVQLAKDLGKPLIIHSREAWDDTFAVLEEVGQGQVQGVFHCFTGGPEVLPKISSLDFYVSFSGIVTFKKASDIQAAAPLVASNRLLVETDCPYLAPQPMRGKRNEPSFVWLVAEKLAELRNTTVEEIAAITTQNARRLFKLPNSSA